MPKILWTLSALHLCMCTDFGLPDLFRKVNTIFCWATLPRKQLPTVWAAGGVQYRLNPFSRHMPPTSDVVSVCKTYGTDFEELLENRDEQLFNKTMNNMQHVLYSLLPPPSAESRHYQHRQWRQWAHNRQLPQCTGHLTDSNFITRMLYRDSYWFHNFTLRLHLHLVLYLTHNVLYFSSTYYYNLHYEKLLIKNVCVWASTRSCLPTEGWLRLSRPGCLVLCGVGLPVQRRSPIQALTGPGIE